MAGRGAEVVHCRNVPPGVRDFFQRDIDRAKKATADRARERLRREKSAAEGNYPGDEEDEEAQVQRAMDLSRAEAACFDVHRRIPNRVPNGGLPIPTLNFHFMCICV